MSYSVTRLTLYAILASLEEDLRHAVELHLAGEPPLEVFEGGIWNRAIDRLNREMGMVEGELSLDEVVLFTDFGDLLQVLNGNAGRLPEATACYFRGITPQLERLLPIRHRVAHVRPLHFDDLANTNDVARNLVQENASHWLSLKSTLQRLDKDPSFVLGIDLPVSDADEGARRHNLPIPDFDETGFVGRREQVDRLVELCLGTYPVVTVVGEGGIGKTALALKAAYEILDLPERPFEAIVWTSAKTSQLTPQEIVRIEGAIQDSLGMFEHVATSLAGVRTGGPLEEVLDYLSQFNILLVLDNLETVLDTRVRSFLERLPRGSKILVTSRIGLGAFEVPLKLQAMDDSDSIQLLRALARVRGAKDLVAMPNAKLARYCKRMNNNPGWIKWFASAVHAGKRPEEVLANPDIFLEFCMSNVFNYLSDGSKFVLKSLLCVPGRHTQAELAYLNEMEVTDLQRAIQELLRTNMVIMTSTPRGFSFESQYELTDLARDYLNKHQSPKPPELKKFTKRKRQLVAAGEEVKSTLESKPYSFKNLSIRSKGDLPVAKYLLDALDGMRRKSFTDADNNVATARNLAPDYFEVYRVDALLKASQGNTPAAQQAYEAAIELEPDSAPLKFWYGGFLLRNLSDAEGALRLFQEAALVDPGSAEVQIEIARANLYLKRFDDCHEILQVLSGRADLSVWEQRQVWDIRLQFFQRKAEHVLEQEHDELGALACLKLLKETYEACPTGIVDLKMREKLKKAIATAIACLHHVSDAESARELDDLAWWLASESGLTYDERVELRLVHRLDGVIRLLRTEKEFGFVRCVDGREFYFSFKALHTPGARSNLSIGQRVSFDLGTNRRGVCAVDVRVSEPDGDQESEDPDLAL